MRRKINNKMLRSKISQLIIILIAIAVLLPSVSCGPKMEVFIDKPPDIAAGALLNVADGRTERFDELVKGSDLTKDSTLEQTDTIKKIVIQSSSNGDGMLRIDDLTIESHPVPRRLSAAGWILVQIHLYTPFTSVAYFS